MKFDVVVNDAMEPRTFPVSAVIDGIPCIPVSKLDTANLPSETVQVYHGEHGGATRQHDRRPNGLFQEVHQGDLICVCARADSHSPITLISYYVAQIKNHQVQTKIAII